MSKNNDQPLGLKQLFGPGRSQLPTLKNREAQRQHIARRQNSSRDQALNKRRNLNDAVGEDDATEPIEGQQGPVITEEEKKQALLNRLEEFKARKAQERLQTLMNRRKPFVVGKSVSSTPSTIPKTPTHSSSKLYTPNVSLAASGQSSSRAGGSAKRMAPGPPSNSKIPMPGFQRAKPNSALKAAAPKSTEKATCSSLPPRAVGVPKTTGKISGLPPLPATMPKREQREEQAGLNDTYEVTPEPAAGAPSDTDCGEKHETVACNEALNETITLENGAVNIDLPIVTISTPAENDALENEEPATAVEVVPVWQPGATSSPEKEAEESGQGTWYTGMKLAFTFKMGNDVGNLPPTPSDAVDRNFTNMRGDVEVNQDSSQQEYGATSGSGQGLSDDRQREKIVEETVHEIRFEGNLGDVEVSGSLRRSTRSTRYTGSFKNATPRHRTPAGPSKETPDAKLKPPPIDKLTFDEDELMGPGIMEVRTPDSLLPMSASPVDNSSIMDDLASLDLSSCTSNAQRPSITTWTSLEVSSDEDDWYFKTPRSASSTPQGDHNGATALDATLNVSSLSSSLPPAPEAIFDAPPATPGSILRKEVVTSTQKKTVRFRHKLGSPVYFDRREPPAATGTPASQIVASFARRQSVMPKENNGDDMMSWSP